MCMCFLISGLSSSKKGRFEVEAVQCHNGLLPNGVLGVVKKLDDTRKHGGDGLLIDEPADGVKSGANDEVVIGGEVFLDCVDDEDDEVVVVAEEEREGEVVRALQEEGVVVSHLANNALTNDVTFKFNGKDYFVTLMQR